MKIKILTTILLILLLGCTTNKNKNNSEEASLSDNILSINGAVIDILEYDDSDKFYIVIKPTNTDHNTIFLVESLAGQEKQQFELNETYSFDVFVKAGKESNRLEISLHAYNKNE